MRKKAVVIGAGRSGRGYLGRLLFEKDYEVTYLDENVEAYDITTGNLLTSYGILEGGVEDVTELTNIHCMLLKNINNAYLVNDQLEVIAFLQGYTDYSEKNDSFILDDSYYVYEVKRRQLEDLLNDAELYLAK